MLYTLEQHIITHLQIHPKGSHNFPDVCFQEISNRTPRSTDPEKTWVSNSYRNFLRGPLVRSHAIVDGLLKPDMGVSLNGGTPKTPPKWSSLVTLVGKPMVVGYHHLRKPPHTTFSATNLAHLLQATSCHTIGDAIFVAIRDRLGWWHSTFFPGDFGVPYLEGYCS